MSTNLHVRATAKATLHLHTGDKPHTVYSNYSLYQTPTGVTHNILADPNVFLAYKNWVMSITKVEEIPVYADDDLFCEGDPVGVEYTHQGEDHIKQLLDWIDAHSGWNIEWYSA